MVAMAMGGIGKGLVLPAAVGVADDTGMGDGSMQYCSEHPHCSRSPNPASGICPLCLQDKLRRLLLVSSSSSSSSSTKPSSSSSSFDYYSAAVARPLFSDDYSPPSPSGCIRPTVLEATVSSGYGGIKAAVNGRPSSSSAHNARAGSSRRSKMIPFFQTAHHRKKKPAPPTIGTDGGSDDISAAGNLVLKRSKSVASRPMGGPITSTRKTTDPMLQDSPRKKSFWSLLYVSSSRRRHPHGEHYPSGIPGGGVAWRSTGYSRDADRGATTTTPYIRDIKLLPHPAQLPAMMGTSATEPPGDDCSRKTPRRECPQPAGSMEEEVASGNSPGCQQASASLFGRKVARSRSVGCGSRSFSGDWLERISTVGLGDCTLRRVESQRESKPKMKMASHHQRVPGDEQERPPPPHRVRCGGIFSGFSSSSDDVGSGRILVVAPAGFGGGENGTPRTRRSWLWAFASPMRAFSRPSSKHIGVDSINNAVGSPFDGTTFPSIAAVGAHATIGAASGAAALLAISG